MSNLREEESIDELIDEITTQIIENRDEKRIGDIIGSCGYLIYRQKFDTFGAKIKDPKSKRERGFTHVYYNKVEYKTPDGKKIIVHYLGEVKGCTGGELAYVKTETVEIVEFSEGFSQYFGEYTTVGKMFPESVILNEDNDIELKYSLKSKIAERKCEKK